MISTEQALFNDDEQDDPVNGEEQDHVTSIDSDPIAPVSSDSPEVQTKKEPLVDTKWYCLRVISGKEKSIKERIDKEILIFKWENIVTNVVVPTEKVYKIVSGKKVVKERNLLPGYILIEAVAGKLNGDIAKTIADVSNVIHFLGKETPIPMTHVESNRLLGKVDESSEAGEIMLEPYLVAETVKIIDGPFTDFIGDIQEVNEEKKKLKVVVKIFGRGTEVELSFLQVEKIS